MAKNNKKNDVSNDKNSYFLLIKTIIEFVYFSKNQ